MGFLDFIFGKNQGQLKEYLDKGAVILDVRTKREWDGGHIKGAKHVPLDDLQKNVESLKKLNKPFIVYCASGARSAQATKFLNLKNMEAINGGGWMSLQKKVLSLS